MKNIRTVFIVTALIIIITFAFFSINNNNNNYEEATKEKIKEFDITNDITEVNKYSLKNVENEEIAKLYYNDYKNMIVNYPDEAYELITNKNITKDEFLGFREKLINNYYNYTYSKYSSYIDQENNCYVYRVIDSKDKVFTFKIYSSMQYEVNIAL